MTGNNWRFWAWSVVVGLVVTVTLSVAAVFLEPVFTS